MEKIRKYNSDDFPVIPGVMVITNDHFKNLYKICNICYEKLGYLPTFSEVSFDYFIPPTKKQVNDLYKNILRVVNYFSVKTPVNLFPDISPELCVGSKEYYVFSLDLKNTKGITKKNIRTKLNFLISKCLRESYVDITKYCRNKNCEWFDSCRHTRRIWIEGNDKISSIEKMEGFCKMKKTINKAFLKALEVLGL